MNALQVKVKDLFNDRACSPALISFQSDIKTKAALLYRHENRRTHFLSSTDAFCMSCGWNDPERSACQRTPACNQIVLCCSVKFHLTLKMFFSHPSRFGFSCRWVLFQKLKTACWLLYTKIKRLERHRRIQVLMQLV